MRGLIIFLKCLIFFIGLKGDPKGKLTETCCDFSQLNTLNSEIGQLRQLFSRCPSCMDNAIHVSLSKFIVNLESFDFQLREQGKAGINFPKFTSTLSELSLESLSLFLLKLQMATKLDL